MPSTQPFEELFLISGPFDSWLYARRTRLWGLPCQGRTWTVARQAVQAIGFRSASHFVACAGPNAIFLGVVDGDVHYDDSSYPFRGSGPREAYPVRFRFTVVRDLNGAWAPERTVEGNGWRSLVRDVYLEKRSLFKLHPYAIRHPEVRLRLERLDVSVRREVA